MKLHTDIVQGSDEWLELRLGKFTASTACAIGNNGKGLETLVYEKAAEILTRKLPEQYTNEDIERGHAMEMAARNQYEMETGLVVTEVAFVEVDEYEGCSPDGLVGDDGLVEIKNLKPSKYVRYMVDRKIDTDHVWQMQMQMKVTGRKWCDYVVHNADFPKPAIIFRLERDERMIAQLVAGLASGKAQLKSILAKLS